METSGIWSRVRRIPAWVIDALVACLLFAGVLGRGLGEPGTEGGWPIVLVAALVGGSIAVRRILPFPALVVASVAAAVAGSFGVSEQALAALGLTAYLVGAASRRTSLVIAGAAIATAFTVLALLAPRIPGFEMPGGPIPAAAVLVAGLAVGRSVRSRRDLEVALRERAERAEEALSEASRRRAVEERLHIARELHDVVGHGIAVVNVQSGVAAHHLRTSPEEAEAALGHVRSSAKTVLHELSTMLGVLRGTGEEEGPGPGPATSTPAPTLEDLDRLVDSIESSGAQVELTISGERRDLPGTVELAAYRIVQEGLTNAGRHGTGIVRVSLGYGSRELSIEIKNRVPVGGSPDRKGYGLVGMNERVAAVGGWVHTGETAEGEFVVTAGLPIVPGEKA